jgi:hypothetical protein
MARTCSRVYSVLNILVCLSFFIPTVLFADTAAKNWVIGAEKFVFTQKKSLSDADTSIASILPQLIMEQITDQIERIPVPQEQLDRTLYDLQQKRVALFLQLSKEVKTRDSLVLGNYTDRQLAVEIEKENIKIADIQKQIDDNLRQTAQEQKNAAPAIEKDRERKAGIEEGRIVDNETDNENRFTKMLKEFVPGMEKNEVAAEPLALYKDDFTQLFDAGKDVSEDGYRSRSFETAVVTAGINALLTGRITLYGNYISVMTELFVYPGARSIGVAADVGESTDLRMLAVSIAHQLMPKITNSMPVKLTFSVTPEIAAKNAVITIDDMVYKEIPEQLIMQSGVHSLLFRAEGYQSAGTSYAFKGSRAFHIDVEMIPDNPSKLFLRPKEPMPGTFYGNGVKTEAEDSDGTVIIKVNGQPVLGQFITDDGSAASFYIPQNMIGNGKTLTVNLKPFDRSKYIETRRRHMYASYSLFIVSLVPTFYTYGSYIADLAAYKKGYGDYETTKQWQTAVNISSGISIGCAAVVIFELIWYFHAANSVLPVYTKETDYSIKEKETGSLPEGQTSDGNEETSGGVNEKTEQEGGNR